MEHIRYSAAACQTDNPNPIDRRGMRANTDRMLSMIDSAVIGASPFLPVRLVVFPEFAHAAPVFETAAELIEKLAIPIPNEHTERLHQKAKEHDIYIQSGSMLEVDAKWPGHVFNTTCLIGPEGVLYKYRKVNPWLPFEVHTSPHDLPDYDEPLFPVADTPRVGCRHYGVDDIVDLLHGSQDFEFGLGQKIDHVLGPAIELGVSLLAAEALGLDNRQALHPDLVQRFLHLVQLEGFDDGFDFFHRSRTSPFSKAAQDVPRCAHTQCMNHARRRRRINYLIQKTKHGARRALSRHRLHRR